VFRPPLFSALLSILPALLWTALLSAQTIAPCEAYWAADAVFAGRVTAVRRIGTARLVSLTVVEGFRGVAESSVDALMDTSASPCRVAFKVGGEYVVYATRSAGGGLSVVCSRTRDVEDAGADLSYARDIRGGKPAPGFVGGRVLVHPLNLSGKPAGPPTPAAGITVTIARNTVSETAVTDAGGEFRVPIQAPGSYRVTVGVPQRFYSGDPEAVVAITDPRGCANVSAMLHDDGHVAGRVLDAKGMPVAGLTIEVGVASARGVRAVTDRNGGYEVSKLPAGRYTLSIPPAPASASGMRPMRVFHPGVDVPARATIVNLTAGQRSVLPDLRLPAQQEYAAISGVVLDATGGPAEGARIYLKGASEGERIVSEPVIADFMGRFIIAARVGGDYILFGERPRPGERPGRVDSTDPLPLTAAPNMKSVRLSLQRRY